MKQVPKTPSELAGHLMPLLDNFRKQRVEETNNKIKTMTRQAYGFRDKEFLKIMAIHLAEYELVG